MVLVFDEIIWFYSVFKFLVGDEVVVYAMFFIWSGVSGGIIDSLSEFAWQGLEY